MLTISSNLVGSWIDISAGLLSLENEVDITCGGPFQTSARVTGGLIHSRKRTSSARPVVSETCHKRHPISGQYPESGGKTGGRLLLGAPITCSLQRAWPREDRRADRLRSPATSQAFGGNPMSALRLDQNPRKRSRCVCPRCADICARATDGTVPCRSNRPVESRRCLSRPAPHRAAGQRCASGHSGEYARAKSAG